MAILFVIALFVVFFLADLAVRTMTRKVEEKKKRQEREEALSISLKLDFTREAKTLRRAEVKDPVARILCVDDEEVILSSFRKILVLDGYAVDTVETGQEALGLLQHRHYDFIFTDLKMPSMEGVEVVKAAKHMRPDIDVVVITGFATVETAVECMKYGALDYVQKPFTEDELLGFVRKALIKRRDRIQKQIKPQVHITHLAAETADRRGDEYAIPGGVLISRGHCWAGLSQDGAVKVGLDDFAKKLIGRIEVIDMPNIGMTIKAGQPLFAVCQGSRCVQFLAPISGQVVKINASLAQDPEALEVTPYQKNWICVIDGENLDAELPNLKIGKSAVSLFEEDIEKLRALSPEMQWDSIAKEFFGR